MSDRRFVLVLVLTALALLLASLALADEIIGGIAFDTSPFACDGNAVAKTWRNSFPFSVRLYRVRITHGRDYGVGADYYTQVIRDEGSWLAWFSQDAYSESAPRILDTAYEGQYASLVPGQAMHLWTKCTQFAGTPRAGAHHRRDLVHQGARTVKAESFVGRVYPRTSGARWSPAMLRRSRPGQKRSRRRPSRVTSFFCLPDTVDPRGPKGK